MERKQGFTLIELLVVIAIVAVLAGILFPVFAKARDKARAVVCQSNLRQLGMAMAIYCSDWDEVYPPCYQWKSRLQPYARNTDINKCPSRPNLPWYYGQGYNIGCADPVVRGFPEQTSGAIVNPSDKILIVEWDRCNAGPPCGPFGLYNDGATCWWAVTRVHSDGSNVLFADTHIKWMCPEQYHSNTHHIDQAGIPVSADGSPVQPVSEEIWRHFWDVEYRN